MRRKLLLVNLLVVMLFASTAMAEDVVEHTVGKNETLSGIALQYENMTATQIQKKNPIIRKIHVIKEGWVLKIPAKRKSELTLAVMRAEKEKKAEDKKKTALRKVAKKVDSEKPTSKKVVESKIVAALKQAVKFVMGDWCRPAQNPYKGDLLKGFSILGYSPEDSRGLLQAVLNKKYVWGIANSKSNGGSIIDEDGGEYVMVKMLSGGGKNQPIIVLAGKNGKQLFLDNEKDARQNEAVRIYKFGEKYLGIFPKCTNPAELIKLPPKVVEKPKPEPKPTPNGGPTKKSPPFIQIPPKVECLDNWDAYLGGGNYLNRVEPKYNYGYYFWAKYRNRPCPFWYTPEENSLGIRNIGFGFVGFLAGGKGTAAQYYKYRWWEGTVGVTVKVYTPHADYDFDTMVGQLRNDGSWKGAKDRDQIDSIFLLSAHANQYREGENVKWFPKREFNAEWRIPFHTRMKRGTKVDNEVIEASYTQWIYKFQLGDNNDSFNLSPGFYFGLGYEKSSDDPTFVKIGPALEVSSYGNVVAGLSFFNYKFQNDGQWHPFGAYISIDGAWRAYEASQITSISEEDLRGLENGSKLLRNPADYL